MFHHFADDTNLLVSSHSIKSIQKQINLDLKALCKWLRANKISLNASKTELLLFRHPNKKFDFDLKIKLDGKKIIPTTHVKYLGIYIDCHLNWKFHVNELSAKLSRAIGMLAKIRYYVCHNTLTMIYHGIFSSILLYGCQIWGLINQPIVTLERIQNKALRIINFEHPRSSTNTLYQKCKILKLEDNVNLSNFLFAHDSFTNNLPTVLCNKLHLTENSHQLGTRNIEYRSFILPTVMTTLFCSNSVKYKSVVIWNLMNKKFHSNQLFEKRRNFCKGFIKNHFFESYS